MLGWNGLHQFVRRFRYPGKAAFVALVATALLSACESSPEAALTTSVLPAVPVTLYPTATQPAAATPQPVSEPPPALPPAPTVIPSPTPLPPHPLQIDAMRQREYPGSEITIEQDA